MLRSNSKRLIVIILKQSSGRMRKFNSDVIRKGEVNENVKDLSNIIDLNYPINVIIIHKKKSEVER